MTNDMIPEDMVERVTEAIYENRTVFPLGDNREYLSRDDARELARAALQAALTTGDYVLVPVEPTEEMIEAGWKADGLDVNDPQLDQVWRFMLAAHPKTKEGGE